MSRIGLLVPLSCAAALAVGCAHCDTCDDFPAPCTGPNCGALYQGVPIGAGVPIESGAPYGYGPGVVVPPNDSESMILEPTPAEPSGETDPERLPEPPADSSETPTPPDSQEPEMNDLPALPDIEAGSPF